MIVEMARPVFWTEHTFNEVCSSFSSPVHADCSLIKRHSLDMLSFSVSFNLFQQHYMQQMSHIHSTVLQHKTLNGDRVESHVFRSLLKPVLQLTLTVSTLSMRVCLPTNWLCRKRPVLSPVMPVRTPVIRHPQQKYLWTGKGF